MEKKNIDWSNIGFGYVQTDKRYVANYKDGAWDKIFVVGVESFFNNSACNDISDLCSYKRGAFAGLYVLELDDGNHLSVHFKRNAVSEITC